MCVSILHYGYILNRYAFVNLLIILHMKCHFTCRYALGTDVATAISHMWGHTPEMYLTPRLDFAENQGSADNKNDNEKALFHNNQHQWCKKSQKHSVRPPFFSKKQNLQALSAISTSKIFTS